ncbi:UNVERIFIED_CONTAM: hypothetical protein FKN15_036402 [Acipenser sinensis]
MLQSLQGPPGSQPSPHAQPPPHNPNMMGPHSQRYPCNAFVSFFISDFVYNCRSVDALLRQLIDFHRTSSTNRLIVQEDYMLTLCTVYYPFARVTNAGLGHTHLKPECSASTCRIVQEDYMLTLCTVYYPFARVTNAGLGHTHLKPECSASTCRSQGLCRKTTC